MLLEPNTVLRNLMTSEMGSSCSEGFFCLSLREENNPVQFNDVLVDRKWKYFHCL